MNLIFLKKTLEMNKSQLEKRLKSKGVRIFNDVHVSVLPNTEVVINNHKGVKIKEIGAIRDYEQNNLKVPAFDPADLKIKWFDAKLIKHSYEGKIFNIQKRIAAHIAP